MAPLRRGFFWPARLTGPPQGPTVLDHSRTLSQCDGRAGPAFAGCAIGGERTLVVLDACDVLHDAFAVRCPSIDAEGEVRARYRHRSQSSKLQVVAAQAVVALVA